MTNKIKKLSFFILSFVFALSLALFFLASSSGDVNAGYQLTLSQELKSEYVVGETFTVPDATISDGANDYQADKFKIVTPSGYAYSNSQITITEPGIYKIYYYKTVGNNVLSLSKTFVVSNNAYTVDKMSSVTYGGDSRLASNVKGLKVSLAAGDTFYYNVPIDLTNKTRDFSILNFIPLPSVQGSPDVEEVYVKLTDAYNPENYVLIKTQHANFDTMIGPFYGRTYNLAKTNGESYIGMEITGFATDYPLWNGARYVINRNIYGMKANCSLTAVNGYGSYTYKLSMNYDKREVYGSDQFNTSGGTNIIADLDNPIMFKNLWNGFTTGECYLSIYTANNVQSSFNFLITNIAENDLSKQTIKGEKEPTIHVESKENVYALVGKEFKVFPSYANDVFGGVVDCNVKVLYNNSINVNCINGSFIPKYAGKYTLIYSVADVYGNRSEVIKTVYAYEQSLMSVEYGNVPAEVVAGKIVKIPEPTITNANGSYSLEVIATLKSNTDVEYKLDMNGDNYEFLPLYSGEYEISYVVSDYAETKIFNKEINVVAGEYVLAKAPKVSKYFIKDATYSVDSVIAYELSSGSPIEKETQVKVAFDGGEYQAVVNNSFLVNANNNVKVGYFCEDTLVEEFTGKVFDVNYGTYEMKIGDYFYSVDNSFVFDKTDKDFSYTAFNVNNEGAETTFINEVSVDAFEIQFVVKTCNFKTLVLELSNGQETLELKLRDNNGVATITVNGVKTYDLKSSFDGSKTIILGYKDNFGQLYVGTENFIISEFFNGFSTNSALLTIRAEEVSSQSKLQIRKINNQIICSEDTDDYMEPQVSYTIDNSGKELNEKLWISDVQAIDVLDPNTKCTITVMSPNGEDYAISDDNIVLRKVPAGRDYCITLSEYGEYRIVLSFEDMIGNDKNETINIQVIDKQAPVITVKTTNQTVSKGDTVEIRKAKVTDNLDKSVKVNKMIISPSGITYNVTSSFTAKEKGTYKVIIYAKDSYGNLSQASYNVIVR